MRRHITLALTGNDPIKIRYAREDVSPETYYDHIHDHPFLEICIIISGRMLHFAGGKTYMLRYGDVFFCRSRELHYALAAEASVYERYAFWVPENAFSWIEGGNEAALGVFSDSRYQDTNVLRIPVGSREKLNALLEEIKKCTEPDSGVSQLCILGHLAELLVFINKEAGSADEVSAKGAGEMPRIIYDVIRYVRMNYRTLNGIDEIAAHFYINKDYLTRVFRRYTGFTVHDYIRSVRISKSKILLEKGTGVTETGFSCGFNSTSYFIRVFEKATGVTPAKYRGSGREFIENRE
jgi:AraC-like DNA-binding protein